ncbi:type VI secretion system lipoprotein TssJ [Vibrio fluvialis]
MSWLNMIRLAAIGCCALGLSACSSSSSTTTFAPTLKVPLVVEASKDINVFDDEQARPVVVRVYQLQDAGNFQKADFISLYNADQSVLADSLVDLQTLAPVLPGELRNLTLDVQQQSRFIAVLVEFAHYETATAKAYLALVSEPEEYPVYIHITKQKVELTQPVSKSWWNVF